MKTNVELLTSICSCANPKDLETAIENDFLLMSVVKVQKSYSNKPP